MQSANHYLMHEYTKDQHHTYGHLIVILLPPLFFTLPQSLHVTVVTAEVLPVVHLVGTTGLEDLIMHTQIKAGVTSQGQQQLNKRDHVKHVARY